MRRGISIRTAALEDARLIWEWRNDPYVREQSLSADRIPWEDHRQWYRRKLKSPDTRIWILSHKGHSAAIARYDRRSQDEWELSFFVGPSFRGNGLGRAVVESTIPLTAQELKTRTIFAQVKADNLISLTLLRHLGFKRITQVVTKGRRIIRMKKKIS